MSQSQFIGVCSWSLLVKSVKELRTLLDRLGTNTVQIACGDPEHAAWEDDANFVANVRAANFDITGAMIGFPGEDYTTPQSIKMTGGFGDPALRLQRLETLAGALERTRSLGLRDLTLHAGFIPEVGDQDRRPFLDTLARAASNAQQRGVTLAFETGQETAELLKRTLDDLKCPNLKVNFDPANMLLYDMGDPIHAVEILASNVRSVHLKDAIRPRTPGTWGEEVPLGQGQVNIPRFLQTLRKIGFRGPMCIERGTGTQTERFSDIANGIRFVRQCLDTDS